MTKLEKILAGERVVCSDAELDVIEPNIPENVRVVSIFNPDRCGLLDKYVVFKK